MTADGIVVLNKAIHEPTITENPIQTPITRMTNKAVRTGSDDILASILLKAHELRRADL